MNRPWQEQSDDDEKERSKKEIKDSIVCCSLTSTLFMISCCMVTDSTGYFPAALSAESITIMLCWCYNEKALYSKKEANWNDIKKKYVDRVNEVNKNDKNNQEHYNEK